MSAEEDQQLRYLLTAEHAKVRRFAFGLTGNSADADDLVQSTYERAFARLGQWTHGSRPDSWLYRIAQSIWFNQLSARKVRNRFARREQAAPQRWVDGESMMEDSLALSRMRALVMALPEDQRVVLLLVSVEGLSYKQAADVLDIPVGTLTSRLARARLTLRDWIYGREVDSRRPEGVTDGD